MDIGKYRNFELAMKPKEFSDKIQRDDFVEYTYLTEDVALLTFDGKTVRCNLPIYLAAKVYSASKR